MTEEQLRNELRAVYGSTSWRITAPLRAISSLIRGEKTIFHFLKPSLLAIIKFAANRPLLQGLGRIILARLPTLRARVHRALTPVSIAVSTNSLFANGIDTVEVDSLKDMSPQALAIYSSMKKAIDNKSNK